MPTADTFELLGALLIDVTFPVGLADGVSFAAVYPLKLALDPPLVILGAVSGVLVWSVVSTPVLVPPWPTAFAPVAMTCVPPTA